MHGEAAEKADGKAAGRCRQLHGPLSEDRAFRTNDPEMTDGWSGKGKPPAQRPAAFQAYFHASGVPVTLRSYFHAGRVPVTLCRISMQKGAPVALCLYYAQVLPLIKI